MKEVIEKDGCKTTVMYYGVRLPERSAGRVKLLKKRFCEYSCIMKEKDNGDLSVSYRTRQWKAVGDRVFIDSKIKFSVGMKNGRAYLRFAEEKDYYYWCGKLVGFFCGEKGLECLYKGRPENDLVFCRAVANKAVLKMVLRGKITNRRMLIREYLKSSYKLKNANLGLVESFLSRRTAFSLQSILSYTTNYEKAIRRILDEICPPDYGASSVSKLYYLFNDLLQDCEILGIRFNPSWSEKRLADFHQKNIRRILDELYDSTNSESVYGPLFEFRVNEQGLHGTVIDNEKSAFLESQEMDHCFYYNYFPKVKTGRYVGLSINSPERCTVGIVLDKDRNPRVEQVHTFHNGSVAENTMDAIRNFVMSHCQQLAELFNSAYKPSGDENPLYDDPDDIPF